VVSSLPHNSPWHRKPSPQPASAQGSHLQSIQSLVATAMAQGTLTRRDHLTLTAAMLSSPSLTATHRQHINQLFDAIRTGQVQVTD
jgi:deoxyxylulose-5-phosphate synthase